MKTLLTIVAATLLTTAGIANAQDAVYVQPEQRTVVHEYVQKNPIASINVLGLELGIGVPVPETVVLHEIPDVEYRYVVVDNRTVIVDPATHQIIEIIE